MWWTEKKKTEIKMYITTWQGERDWKKSHKNKIWRMSKAGNVYNIWTKKRILKYTKVLPKARLLITEKKQPKLIQHEWKY